MHPAMPMMPTMIPKAIRWVQTMVQHIPTPSTRAAMVPSRYRLAGRLLRLLRFHVRDGGDRVVHRALELRELRLAADFAAAAERKRGLAASRCGLLAGELVAEALVAVDCDLGQVALDGGAGILIGAIGVLGIPSAPDGVATRTARFRTGQGLRTPRSRPRFRSARFRIACKTSSSPFLWEGRRVSSIPIRLI